MKIKKALLLLVVETMVLYIILGGVGLFSVNHLKKEITGGLVSLENLEKMTAKLEHEFLTNRRYEKDLFLNASQTAKQQEYLKKFKQSSDTVTSLLVKLPQKLEKYPDIKKMFEEKLLHTVMDYSIYINSVISIAHKSMADTTLTSRYLNGLMSPVKEHIYVCEKNISAIYNEVENRHNDNIKNIVVMSEHYSILLALLTLASAVILAIILLLHRSNITKGINLLGSKIAEFASGSFKLNHKISWDRDDEFSDIVKNLNVFMNNLRKVYARIAENEENLRTTLNSIGDGVVVTDNNADIVQMNPVAEKLSGENQDNSYGKSVDDIMQLFCNKKPHKLTPAILSMKTSSDFETIHLEANLVSKTGTDYLVSTSVSAIRHQDGSLLGSILVFRDITVEQKLRERVSQSDKMESIGQLAGGVAHDFNNMLGGIRGAAELLLMESPDGTQKDYLNMILETTTRAAALNRQLLTFSRKNNNKSTVFSVHKAINNAVEILKHSVDKKVTIVVNELAEKDSIIGDSVQLQNAILNLGINARDAINNEGTILISTKNEIVTETYIEQLGGDLTVGEYIRIDVEDDGTGMDKTTRERIFEPFFTTKEVKKGTGLGLAAVFGTVKEHHGNISVYSESGTGTAFHILLPLTEETAIEITDEYNITLGKGTILIVDDEHILRKVASSILKNAGYSTLSAENGQEGVEVFAKHKDTIDLVLLDMIMPVMDGRDCFNKIHEISPDTPVIMASGYTSDLRVQKIKDMGVKALLTKPYRAAELTATIFQVLRETTQNDTVKERSD